MSIHGYAKKITIGTVSVFDWSTFTTKLPPSSEASLWFVVDRPECECPTTTSTTSTSTTVVSKKIEFVFDNTSEEDPNMDITDMTVTYNSGANYLYNNADVDVSVTPFNTGLFDYTPTVDLNQPVVMNFTMPSLATATQTSVYRIVGANPITLVDLFNTTAGSPVARTYSVSTTDIVVSYRVQFDSPGATTTTSTTTSSTTTSAPHTLIIRVANNTSYSPLQVISFHYVNSSDGVDYFGSTPTTIPMGGTADIYTTTLVDVSQPLIDIDFRITASLEMDTSLQSLNSGTMANTPNSSTQTHHLNGLGGSGDDHAAYTSFNLGDITASTTLLYLNLTT